MRMGAFKSVSFLAVTAALMGCPGVEPAVDAGVFDAGEVDAGIDAGEPIDAGAVCAPYHHDDGTGQCVQAVRWEFTEGFPDDEARDHHMTATFHTDAGEFLVVAGGMASGDMFSTVWTTQVLDAGVLAPWTKSANGLPEALAGGAVAVFNGRVYMLGGIDGSSNLTLHTYSAPLNTDGTLGTWRPERPLAGTARYHHSAFILGNSLFVIGGFNGQSIFSFAHQAVIAPDGSLGDWAVVANAGAMSHHASVVANGRVYLVGGFNGSGAGILDVRVSSLDADGGLAAWQVTANNLPSRHRTHSVSVIGDALYLLNGEDGSGTALGNAFNGALRAELLSDGGTGPWEDLMTTNPAPRRHTHQSPAVGGTAFGCLGSDQNMVMHTSCAAMVVY